MICISCKQEIEDGTKFCSFCGAIQEKDEAQTQKDEAQAEKVYCPECRKEFDADRMYCDECGLILRTKAELDAADFKKTDEKLMEIPMASIYRGNVSMGTPIFTGKLYFYTDRIDKKPLYGGIQNIFIKTEDIAEAKKGSYMVVWSSIHIKMKNGTFFTIVGGTTGAETINRALQMIKDNMV
ncbi:MAG: zinc ribbon domain-containing protein [Clostridia bacterium]|nr:zinc ribbon domain-containing protein [Clostridia bacterium]